MNIGDLLQRWTNGTSTFPPPPFHPRSPLSPPESPSKKKKQPTYPTLPPSPFFIYLIIPLDTLKSSLHRVTPPTNLSTNLPTNLSTTTNPAPPAPPQRLIIPARYSIPYFVAPALDTIVTCLPQCTHETRPAKHAPILWKEYMLMRASMNYER